MKLRCIYSIHLELTFNKLYEGSANGPYYRVNNDRGNMEDYYCRRFKEVLEADDQKIIGYKLRKDLPGLKAGFIFTQNLGGNWDQDPTDGDANWYTQEEIDAEPDWFEPVYEQQEVILELGNRKKSVKIGRSVIESDGWLVPIGRLSEIIEKFSTLENIGSLPVVVNGPTKFLRIGCIEENNLFSLDEINQVITTYQKING